MKIDTKKHWETIYNEKSPLELSWYQNEPTLSLELIANTGVQKNAPIIDIGGGASVLVDRLLDVGYSQLAVLDISRHALDFAQTRLAEQADKIEWYERDVTRFIAPHPFALWHDRAVFHFLTAADDRQRYIKALNQALRPGSHVIIAAFAIGGPRQCSGLDIVQYDAQKLCAELGENFELVETRDETHFTPTKVAQAFGYFRFTIKA